MSVTNSTQNIREGISDKETFLLSTLAKEGKNIFGLKDISSILKTNYPYSKVIADRLRKKKWLIPVTRGKYLLVPLSAGIKSEYTEHEFVIASHLASKKEYYIAYWSALNHYGFTEQTPFTVFVATTSRRPNVNVHGVDYKFITINDSKFFGIRNHFINNNKIVISDKEKTLVDALDHPEYCGGISEVAKCLWNAKNEISFEKIINYAKKMQNTTIIKRLGYLIDILEIEISALNYHKMQNSIGKGRSWLDPGSSKKRKSHLKWKLFVNVPNDWILEAKSLT